MSLFDTTTTRADDTSDCVSCVTGKGHRVARTLNAPRLSPAEVAAGIDLLDEPTWTRPKTRGDCVSGPRPCPWALCRHHLAVEVTPAGSLVLSHGHGDIESLAETCSLDVADRGEHRPEVVGALLGLTRQRASQIESTALAAKPSRGLLALAGGAP